MRVSPPNSILFLFIEMTEDCICGTKHKYYNDGILASSNLDIVCKVHDENMQPYICKFFHKQILNETRAMKDFMAKLNIVKTIRHPNIICIEEVIDMPDVIAVITEFCSKGHLQTYISTINIFTEKKLFDIAEPILHALNHLHELGIYHGCLYPSCIMLDDSKVPKLINFGLWADFTIKSESDSTDLYLSPEQIRREAGNNYQASDIWSLGIILYRMATGKLPFPSNNRMKRINMILSKDIEIPENLSKPVRELLQHMLVRDPTQRASANYIISHLLPQSSHDDFSNRRPSISIDPNAYLQPKRRIQQIANSCRIPFRCKPASRLRSANSCNLSAFSFPEQAIIDEHSPFK